MADTVARLNIMCGATNNASGVLNIIKGNIAGLVAAAAGVGAAIMISKSTISGYADFNKTLTNSITMFGELDEEMEGALETATRELATNIPRSANDAAEALYYFGSAGLNATDALGALDTVGKFAVANNISMEESAQTAASMMKLYGIDVENLEGSLDQTTYAMKTSLMTMTDMNEALSYVGGIAATSGISISELGALLSVFADAGIKGSMAGTALRRVISNLKAPTNKVKTALDDMGVSIYDDAGNMRDFGVIIQEIITALGGMTEEEAAVASEALAGTRALSGFSKIASLSADQFAKMETDIEGAGGTIQEMFVTQMDTPATKIATLSNKFNELKMSIGEALIPVLETLMGIMEPLIGFFTKHNTVLAGLIVSVGLLSTAYLAMKAAMMIQSIISAVSTGMGLLAAAMGISTAATGGATVATWGFNAALLANPIVWIIIAIVALIAAIVLLWKNWDEVSKALGEAWDWMKEKFGAVKDAIVGFVGNIKEKWTEFGNKVKEKCGDIKESIVDFASKTKEKLTTWASTAKEKITGFASTAKEKITTWATDAGKKVAGFVINAVKKFGEFKTKGVKNFKDFASKAKAKLVGLKNDAMAIFRNAASWLIDAGKNIIKGLIKGIRSMAGAVGNAIKDAVGGAWDALTGVFDFGSPSKVMMRAGQDVIRGFNLGLENIEVNPIISDIPLIETPSMNRAPSEIGEGTSGTTYHIVQNLSFQNVADETYIHKIGSLVQRNLERVIA